MVKLHFIDNGVAIRARWRWSTTGNFFGLIRAIFKVAWSCVFGRYCFGLSTGSGGAMVSVRCCVAGGIASSLMRYERDCFAAGSALSGGLSTWFVQYDGIASPLMCALSGGLLHTWFVRYHGDCFAPDACVIKGIAPYWVCALSGGLLRPCGARNKKASSLDEA